MHKTSTEKMTWLNENDLELVEDETEKKCKIEEHEVKWTKDIRDGILEVKSVRRSPRTRASLPLPGTRLP